MISLWFYLYIHALACLKIIIITFYIIILYVSQLRKSFREIPGFENVVPVVTKFRWEILPAGCIMWTKWNIVTKWLREFVFMFNRYNNEET